MNILDVILAVPIVWGAYRGFRKGLVYEVSTFVALFAGIYGALHYSGIAEPYLETALGEDQDRLPLIAFASTFLVILIGTRLLGRIVNRLIEWIALGLINRSLGALFGVLKVALFMIAILIMLRSYGPSKNALIPRDLQKGSLLLSYMDRGTERVMRYDLGEDWPSERGASDN